MNIHNELITPELRTTSRIVAEKFGKSHKNVIRDIREILDIEDSGIPEDWGMLNFEQTPYVDDQNGQTYPMYEITRDGFTFLAMGFTGKRAAAWKIRFIEAFNAMEGRIEREQHTLSTPDSAQDWLSIIRETRRVYGVKAAQAIYDKSPFSGLLPDMKIVARPDKKDEIQQFIKDAGEKGRTKSELLRKFRSIRAGDLRVIMDDLEHQGIIDIEIGRVPRGGPAPMVFKSA